MDELWDEGAVAGDDAAVGAALLMADLEGAIAAAGDEIASLRRVTEAVPRPGLPPGVPQGSTAAPEAGGELERSSSAANVAPELVDGANVQAANESLLRIASDGVVADALPAATSPVGAPAAPLDRLASVRPAERALRQATAPVADHPLALATSNTSMSDATELAASAPVAQASDRLPPSSDPVSNVELRDAAPAGSAAPIWPAEAEPPNTPFEAEGVAQTAPVRSTGASTREAAGVESSAERASAGRQESAAASQDAARGGPTEGDVYLDGERVGRWMAKHLARELGGPQAAGTGFDPRLGPAWPGSLHGS